MFRRAADAAEAAGDGNARGLRSLADVVSMMLSSDTHGEPFKPLALFGNQRSAIPADLRAKVDLSGAAHGASRAPRFPVADRLDKRLQTIFESGMQSRS